MLVHASEISLKSPMALDHRTSSDWPQKAKGVLVSFVPENELPKTPLRKFFSDFMDRLTSASASLGQPTSYWTSCVSCIFADWNETNVLTESLYEVFTKPELSCENLFVLYVYKNEEDVEKIRDFSRPFVESNVFAYASFHKSRTVHYNMYSRMAAEYNAEFQASALQLIRSIQQIYVVKRQRVKSPDRADQLDLNFVLDPYDFHVQSEPSKDLANRENKQKSSLSVKSEFGSDETGNKNGLSKHVEEFEPAERQPDKTAAIAPLPSATSYIVPLQEHIGIHQVAPRSQRNRTVGADEPCLKSNLNYQKHALQRSHSECFLPQLNVLPTRAAYGKSEHVACIPGQLTHPTDKRGSCSTAFQGLSLFPRDSADVVFKPVILKNGQWYDVVVPNVASNGDIYVQFLSQNRFIDVFTFRIQMYYNLLEDADVAFDFSSFSQGDDPLNAWCAAPFPVPKQGAPQDDFPTMYYRAKLLTRCSASSYKVHFVDYGNKAYVTASALRSLPATFRRAPPLATRCRLTNPLGAKIDAVVLRHLVDQIALQPTLTAVVRVHDAAASQPPVVSLFTTDGSGENDVGAEAARLSRGGQ